VLGELAGGNHVADVAGHAFADPRDGQQGFLVLVDLRQLLIVRFNGLGGAAIGSDAEGIFPSHLHKVGGLMEDAGDGFVVGRRWHGFIVNRRNRRNRA